MARIHGCSIWIQVLHPLSDWRVSLGKRLEGEDVATAGPKLCIPSSCSWCQPGFLASTTELLDLHAFVIYVETASQQAPKPGTQLPRKPLVGTLQPGHSAAHDTVLTREIVELDITGLGVFSNLDLAVAHPVQKGVDLVLR